MRVFTLLHVISFLFLLICTPLAAQRSDHIPGEMIVWLEKSGLLNDILSDYSQINNLPTGLQLKKQLIPGQPIFLLRADKELVDESTVLYQIRLDPRVIEAQYNHLVQSRSLIPNDSLFSQQWNFLNAGIPQGPADIDMDLAWDITTGGTTQAGHSIVVAVIDDGIDPDHPDIAPNLWYNTLETPLNGIDDDQNGYTDDYAGWNVDAGFDLVQYGLHGQQVAGLIGARGNNEIGISGVNWEVEIMPIVGISGIESEIIEAYGYALNQRMLFQQTGGALGALVSCINTSWGVDAADPEDYPIWCALFDLLGQQGILSVAATTNSNVDVDLVGDMPTNCGSAYLISVTATDAADQRNFSGYGSSSVDLAAPGEDVLTTDIDEGYTIVSGTSFAAPQVAGLIALMYSVPCEQVAQMALNQPQMLATACRNAILDGVDPVPDLDEEVASGGRLNAFKSLQEILQQCNTCLPPAGLQSEPVSDSSVILSWVNLPGAEMTYIQWRQIDSADWEVIEDPQSPYLLEGLQSCTKYEFRLNAYCSNSTSGFSNSTPFSTPGCCEMPNNFIVADLQSQSAFLSWDPVYGTDFYFFRYRENDSVAWTNLQLEDPWVELSDLPECLSYEAEVLAKCGPDQFSGIAEQNFQLPGCNNCLDQTYCDPVFYSQLEWIESFSVGNETNPSGNNGGYVEFTDTGWQFAAGATYPFTIVPGFTSWTYFESYMIWIDLDQDGEFEDPQELLYGQIPFATYQTLQDSIYIPDTALAGSTRMRVMQVYTGPYGLIFPFSCTIFGEYGEVEDYCIEILDPGSVNTPCTVSVTPLLNAYSETSLSLSWEDEMMDVYAVRYRADSSDPWVELETEDPFLTMEDLEPCTTYEVQIAGWCSDGAFSGYGVSNFYTTECTSVSTNAKTAFDALRAFPNPFRETLQLQGQPGTGYFLQFIDINGRKAPAFKLEADGFGSMLISADQLPDYTGPCFLRWISEDGKQGVIRLVKS